MARLNVIYDDVAVRLLDQRDRFTSRAIKKEFERDPQKNAVSIDPAEAVFLTPVLEGRFTVIWRLDDPGAVSVVQAVLPLTSLDPHAPGFKEYLKRAVQAEMKG
jgi:hypothetical protein